MEKINKAGQTLDQFLAAYEESRYPHCFVTSDVALFDPRPDGLFVLLIRRADHPFLGCWALPGGFVEPDETPLAAACRELGEETGISGAALRQCALLGNPRRDPRARIVTAVHWGLLPQGASAIAGDDAADTGWFRVDIDGRRRKARQDFTLTLSCPQARETLVCSASRVRDALGWDVLPQSGPGGLAADHDEALFRALLALTAAGLDDGSLAMRRTELTLHPLTETE